MINKIEGCEKVRLTFLVDRDGEEGVRAWALKTARIYRAALLDDGKDGGKKHFATSREYRRKFIDAYLHLKRFSI